MFSEFKSYNLYHKTVVIGVIALIMGLILHGVRAQMSGVVSVEHQATLPRSTASLWPYVSDPDLRDNWIVGLEDHASLTSQADHVGKSRLLFWKLNSKRWDGTETTTDLVQERLYGSYIDSDNFEANWRVELTPLGPCSTQVHFFIKRREKTFIDRFFAPLHAGEREEQLAASLKSLDYWAARGGTCDADSLKD